MSNFLKFEPQPYAGKTDIVRVVSKSQNSILGTIGWYGAWRQYVFFPSAQCVFSAGCLDDINGEVRRLMIEWRERQTEMRKVRL